MIIRNFEYANRLEFNMLGAKKSPSASHSLKTLVTTAVQAYYTTLLSSNGNGNRFDLHEKLFIITRT